MGIGHDIYDGLKEFQTFAAACVALFAAVTAFFSQRYVANKQSITSLDNTQKQINAQKEKERYDRYAERLQFAVMQQMYVQIAISKSELLSQYLRAVDFSKAGAAGILERPVEYDYHWYNAFNFVSINDAIEWPKAESLGFKFSSVQVQRSFVMFKALTRQVDNLHREIISFENKNEKISQEDMNFNIKNLENIISFLKKQELKFEAAVTILDEKSAFSGD